jgi:hypothetical protein
MAVPSTLAFLGARIQRIALCRGGTGTNLDLDATERASVRRPSPSAPLLKPEQPHRRGQASRPVGSSLPGPADSVLARVEAVAGPGRRESPQISQKVFHE